MPRATQPGVKAASKKAATKKATTKKPSRRGCPEPLAKARVKGILDGLAKAYPDATCALQHRSAWELLVATILSAQCTDARVNMVTPELFRKYPTIAAMATADLEAIETEIRSTGFYRNKAKSLQGAARRIMEAYGGKVPERMEDLLTLPGVARKTANVVLGVWFHQATGVVVDTHVDRVSHRLQLTENQAAEKIEQDLMRIVPQEQWIAFSHRVIAHGRALCVARKPKCAACPIEKLCCAPDKTVRRP